jgi:hypothetical protein
MATPQPFARKTLALLRFVAGNRPLLLIIARNPGARLGIALSREWTQRHSPRTLTQTNPALAQIFLSYGANFLSQSDRIRPNLSQRLFRLSFRPNLTYGQVRLYPCGPLSINPENCPNFLPSGFSGSVTYHFVLRAPPLSNSRGLKVAKAYSRLGKVQKMHAGLKVKPGSTFNEEQSKVASHF